MTCLQPILNPVPLRLDDSTGVIIEGTRTMRLTPFKAKILRLLLDASPRPVTRDHVFDGLFPFGAHECSEKTIDVHMHQLRKCLVGFTIYIRNHRSLGWSASPSEQERSNFDAETDANARLIEEARELQYITELFIRWMMPDPTVDIDALHERARAASHRIRGTGPCDPRNQEMGGEP